MNLTPKQTIKGRVAETQSLKGVMKDIPSLDNTLTKEGFAADAKAVGDALNAKAPISHTEDRGNPHGVTASQVGARPDTWMPSASEIGARPNTWMPSASDVGARPNTWTPSAQEVGARPDTWMPTAQEVGARPDTWMPTAEDVGAATPTEVNNAVKKGNPVNLLDNSDFRNHVNQRGFTSISNSNAGITYVMDRWEWWNVGGGTHNVTLTKGVGLVIGSKSATTRLLQRINNDIFDSSKTYTAFCKLSDGTLLKGSVDNTTLGGDTYSALFDVPANATVIWAVMYEGEYTAETLPEYHPKGYGTELVECMRYYQKGKTIYVAGTNSSSVPGVRFPVEMRKTPTITINDVDGTKNAVTRWNGSGVTSVTVTAIPADKNGIFYMAASANIDGACGYGYEASADL